MTFAIQTWLNLPVPAVFLVLVLLFAGFALLTGWIAFRWPLRTWAQGYTGVVAPFFTAVSILFALQLGFLGQDVADRNRQSVQAVDTEAHALREVQALSLAAVADMANLREALRAYLQSLLRDEWPIMSTLGPAQQTEAAFATMLRQAAEPRITGEAGQALHSALLAALGRAGQARSNRLTLAADHTNELKWLAVLLLGLITVFAIGLVHLDKARAMAASLVVFSAAAIVAIGLVAIQEWPFDGPMQVEPKALRTLLATLPAPPS